MKTFWLSFASDEAGNLGVVIVDGLDLADAVSAAHRLKINPGGDVMGFEMPPDAEDEVMRFGKNRLIPAKELVEKGYLKLSEVPEEVAEWIEGHPLVGQVHGKCNQ